MKIYLTKSQITDLFGIMGKNLKEDSDLYRDLKSIIRLYPRVSLDREFDLDLSQEDMKMLRELLTPREKEITGENIFEEMKKGMKKHY
ncbi:MAG: hypothetical protein Q8O92_14885 [Candidatus Latescibacter sp.]|nr:hypothetical protein [Candidatus Latescibacter sp.]